MEQYYLNMVSAWRNLKRNNLAGLLGCLCIALACAPLSAAQLTPYNATYTSTQSGVTVDLTQTLSQQGGDKWRLRNKTSLLFVSFEEASVFRVDDDTVTPLTYSYDNSINSKRSSQMEFNWDNNTVIDHLHSKTPRTVKGPVWDKLSVQAQIRLDLMNQGEAFSQKPYPQIVRADRKDYVVTKLGEEILHTELGDFETIKLEERRDNRDKYTLIWVAKNWNYMILRLQRMEDGEIDYQINLKEATLEGEKLKGR